MIDLYPYQEDGSSFLASKKHALLADEMGLGKSCQAISACDQINAKRVLVLCPAVARLNWDREFTRFSQIERESHVVMNSKGSIIGDLVICSYDLASRKPILDQLTREEIDVLILDESHFLKNRQAKRTKIVYSKLLPLAKRVFCLSGTPAPNDPSELWTMLNAFGVYRKRYWDFVREYCTGFQDNFGFKITGGKNIPHLKQAIQPIMLRRKKEEVLKDLPPIRYSEIVVEKSEVDEEIYFPETLAPNHVLDFKPMLDAVKLILDQTQGEQTLQALHAIGGNKYNSGGVAKLRRFLGVSKAPGIAELIANDLQNGMRKIVVFAVHRDVIVLLRDALRKEFGRFGVVTLFGGTPPKRRQENIDRFQTNPKCRIFIGQVVAAGTAITLTAAHDVLFAEASWNPADNAQAAMRCHRIGQDEPVFVRFVSAAGTIDERIQRVLRRKTETITRLFG